MIKEGKKRKCYDNCIRTSKSQTNSYTRDQIKKYFNLNLFSHIFHLSLFFSGIKLNQKADFSYGVIMLQILMKEEVQKIVIPPPKGK